MEQTIRTLIDGTISLSCPAATVPDDANLFDLGMSSFDMLRLVVALEWRFDIQFDEADLTPATFANIASIRAAVSRAGGHV
jgi:acyl carrier protein